eukprot:6201561-Pleurochrysis_carterae.AAC.2
MNNVDHEVKYTKARLGEVEERLHKATTRATELSMNARAASRFQDQAEEELIVWQRKRIRDKKTLVDAEAKLSDATAVHNRAVTRLSAAEIAVKMCLYKMGSHYTMCSRKEKTAREELRQAAECMADAQEAFDAVGLVKSSNWVHWKRAQKTFDDAQ